MSGGHILSLNFELIWGMIDAPDLKAGVSRLQGTRAAIPRILDLFRRRGISCTWATVGFLFFVTRDALMDALPDRRPDYGRPGLSSYDHLDWIGPDERRNPVCFGRSLICSIQETLRQEIGTHTFSHYYCLEGARDGRAFAADLDASVAAGAELSITLRSIVFPRNQVREEALLTCASRGIDVIRRPGRGRYDQLAPRDDEGLMRRTARCARSYLPFDLTGPGRAVRSHHVAELPTSRFLRPVGQGGRAANWAQIATIRTDMRRAARRGTQNHLSFHPHNFGCYTDENLAMLDQILATAERLADTHNWHSLTMAEAARAPRLVQLSAAMELA